MRRICVLVCTVSTFVAADAHAEERRTSRAVTVGLVVAGVGFALSTIEPLQCIGLRSESCAASPRLSIPLIGYPLYRDAITEKREECTSGCVAVVDASAALGWLPTLMQWGGLITALVGLSASSDRSVRSRSETARWTAAPAFTSTSAGMSARLWF